MRAPGVVRCRPGGPGAGDNRGEQVSLWTPGAVAAAAVEATAMKPPRAPPRSSLWVLGGKNRASSSLGRDDELAWPKGDYWARGEGRSPECQPSRRRPRDRPGRSRQPQPRPRAAAPGPPGLGAATRRPVVWGSARAQGPGRGKVTQGGGAQALSGLANPALPAGRGPVVGRG